MWRKQRKAPFVASLLLVVWPGAPSSFFLHQIPSGGSVGDWRGSSFQLDEQMGPLVWFQSAPSRALPE